MLGFNAGACEVMRISDTRELQQNGGSNTSCRQEYFVRRNVIGGLISCGHHDAFCPLAIQQNPMHMVLPCQGIADAVRIGKPLRATDTEGMYPKTGIGRHQKPGLATQVIHPVNGPLMPIASNVFPYGPSPLGQPA